MFQDLYGSSRNSHTIFGICQTIHVAIVCAGYNASRDVVTLVKSVLFHSDGEPSRAARCVTDAEPSEG
ncbi:hypothetical protein LDENG_00250960 [Lucifuga dentata]|nr:hypothetical protein LDENG_00250960 [Lucifuga dentata]